GEPGGRGVARYISKSASCRSAPPAPPTDAARRVLPASAGRCPASLGFMRQQQTHAARCDAMLRVAREPGSMGMEQPPPERPDVDQALERLLRADDGKTLAVAE